MDSEKIQKKLIHFLVGIQAKKNMSAQDVSDFLGYDIRHYKKILSGNTQGLEQAVETINKLSKLGDMSTSGFLDYLEERPSSGAQDSWIQEIAKAFGQLNLSIRRFLTKKIINKQNKGLVSKEKFDLIFGLACLASVLEKEDLMSVSNIMISIAKKTKDNNEVKETDFDGIDKQVAKIRNILNK